MSGSVDNRVVRMSFDNSRFKKAAQDTKASLDNVVQSVKNAGNSKGLLDLTTNMDKVAVHASKMQIAVGTAVGTISNKLTNAGINLAKSLTLDPIRSGFNEYEALLNKQNVIMNATGKSADEVKKVLSNLNTYSDKTIFSFSDMTEGLTSFVNAGVPLDKAQQAMRGIANASALAGASTQEAQSSFRAFGQALGQGFLGLQDFRQAAVTGKIGTVGFKQELINAGVAAGTLRKRGKEYLTQSGKVLTATKGFDLSLQTQWASAKVLNSALNKYGDETKGVGKKAYLAATQVRTFSAFIDTTKEAVGSGFANVFTSLLGGLEDSTATWTKLANAVGGVVGAFFKFITTSLDTFRALHGQKQLIIGFKNILAPFGALFKAVGDAFHSAFPKSASASGGTLYGLAVAFRVLTTPLALLAKLISFLVYPLTAFFQILRIGGTAIGFVIQLVVDFVKGLYDLASFKMPDAGGAGTLLGWIKTVISEIGRALGVVTSLLNEGASLKDAFSALGDIDLKIPKFPGFGKIGLPSLSLGGLFGGKDGDKTATTLDTLQTKAVAFSQSLDTVHDSADTVAKNALFQAGQGFNQGVTNIKELSGSMDGYLTPSLDGASGKASGFIGFVQGMIDAVKKFFGAISGEDVATGLNFAVLATIGLSFAKFLRGTGGFFDTFKKIADSITGVFESLGSAIDEFAASRKRDSQANLIKQIAIAIGILAISLLILSRIPQDKMIIAFQGLAGAMVVLSATMFIMSKALSKMPEKSNFKMIALGAAMVLLGFGILELAIAMKVMQTVGLDAVLKTLLTVVVVMKSLEIIANTGAKSAPKMIAASVAMVLIGIALGVLATAMLIFKLVKPSDMVKAGLALAAITAAVFIMSKAPASSLLTAGIAFAALAISMQILVIALLGFALVKWESIGKASVILLALTVSLVAMALVGGASGAAAILAVGGALLLIAIGCLALNKVNWSSIAKASVILLVLVVAFAAFMAVVAVATAVGATEALTALALGIAAMAFAIALLVTSLALILPILALGVGAFAAFATGAAVAIAAFLQTLALEAPNMKTSVIKIIQVFLDGIAESIPVIAAGIKKIVQAIWDVFTSPGTGDKIADGGKSMLTKLTNAIKKYAPIVLGVIVGLLVKLVDLIKDNSDNIAGAGVALIIALINGLASKVDDLVEAAANLIITFIRALGDQAKPLAEAGLNLIVQLVNGIADAIRATGGPLGDAIANAIAAMAELGSDLVEGISYGIGVAVRNAATSPWNAIKNVVKGVVEGGKEEADAHSPARKMIPLGKFLVMGLAKGIQDNAVLAITAIANVVTGQIAIATQYMSKFVQDLDQKSIAARAKAEGLALAADKASNAAQKTKSKIDDEEAAALKDKAEKAAEKADAADEATQKAKDRADRADQFKDASTLDKAKMKSEDAASALDEAKKQEANAARDQAAANELLKLSKGGLGKAGGGGGASAAQRSAAEGKIKSLQARLDKGFIDEKERKDIQAQIAVQKKIAGNTGKAADAILTAADRAVLAAEAKALQAKSKKEVEAANAALELAKKNAAEALAFQKQAGAEAADAFQKEFERQAKEDADAQAFDALTDAQKVLKLQADAATLATKAKEDLEAAKKLAYTDLEGANALASQANDEADNARQMLQDAVDLQSSIDKDAADKAKEAADKLKAEGPLQLIGVGADLNLQASAAAQQAFDMAQNTYSDAAAAAASGPTNVQFIQNNNSPEALSPTEIYRQTNNLLAHAADKLVPAA